MVPRVVLVTRPTAYEGLLNTHSTHGQARFFLASRGEDIEPVRASHDRIREVLHTVRAAIPGEWRQAHVARADLDRFLFEPDDVVVAVGQDGLVANVARFLSGQPVIGCNPDPSCFDGVLVRYDARATAALLRAVGSGRARVEQRTMVEARLGDGQVLRALNEVFLGHRSHQSARYRIRSGRTWERSDELV